MADAHDSKSCWKQCGFKSHFGDHIETIGLIPIKSVLFSFYRAISLILGINCLILGEVALFNLPVLKAAIYQKHELTKR